MRLALDTDVLVAWSMVGATRHGEAVALLARERKRVLDTALAATLESAGIRRLATFNGADYAAFPFLEVVAA